MKAVGARGRLGGGGDYGGRSRCGVVRLTRMKANRRECGSGPTYQQRLDGGGASVR